MAIFIGQGKTISHKLKFFKSQCLAEFSRQVPRILHVMITFIGFKVTFSNIGSHKSPLLISAPPRISQLSQTSGPKGLRNVNFKANSNCCNFINFILSKLTKSSSTTNCRNRLTDFQKGQKDDVTPERRIILFSSSSFKYIIIAVLLKRNMHMHL